LKTFFTLLAFVALGSGCARRNERPNALIEEFFQSAIPPSVTDVRLHYKGSNAFVTMRGPERDLVAFLTNSPRLRLELAGDFRMAPSKEAPRWWQPACLRDARGARVYWEILSSEVECSALVGADGSPDTKTLCLRVVFADESRSDAAAVRRRMERVFRAGLPASASETHDVYIELLVPVRKGSFVCRRDEWEDFLARSPVLTNALWKADGIRFMNSGLEWWHPENLREPRGARCEWRQDAYGVVCLMVAGHEAGDERMKVYYQMEYWKDELRPRIVPRGEEGGGSPEGKPM
jgi:hypothetical protein